MSNGVRTVSAGPKRLCSLRMSVWDGRPTKVGQEKTDQALADPLPLWGHPVRGSEKTHTSIWT